MTLQLDQMTKEITAQRDVIIDKLVQFSLTDMLFFWGGEKELMERQMKEWQPLLDWAKEEFHCKYVTTRGLDVPEENRESGYRLRFFLKGLADEELAAFYAAATNTRSVLVAAALVKGKISAGQAYQAAFLEELYQAENWGSEENAEKKRREMKQELEEIEAFLQKKAGVDRKN